MPRRLCRILLIGGSGKRAEAAIFPALLAMADSCRELETRVAAICDPVDPWMRTEHQNLRRVLGSDGPVWIPAEGDPGSDCVALDRFVDSHPVDLAILSSGPVSHLAYARWAVRRGIHVVCDKPPHVVPGAASDASAAARILPDYDSFLAELALRREGLPGLHGSVTLSRRAWKPVRNLFSLGRSMKELFGQGMTHLQISLSNGIHRFPAELTDPGAHGFLHGVGLLTHSAYHYIDLAAALLEAFPPEGLASRAFGLAYAQRLEDYVQTDAGKTLRELCGEAGPAIDPPLSPAALRCENSVNAHLTLFSERRHALGHCAFSFQNASFTPRAFRSHPWIDNPDNLGMRMAQLIMDVHFGALANVRILQNNVAGEPPRVFESIRLHPGIIEAVDLAQGERVYEGEDLKGNAGGGLFRESVLQAMGVSTAAEERSSLVDFREHRPTVALFGEFYRALADQG